MAAWERAEPMNSSCYGFPFAKHCGALPQASRKACAETAGGRKACAVDPTPKEGPALLIFGGGSNLKKRGPDGRANLQDTSTLFRV